MSRTRKGAAQPPLEDQAAPVKLTDHQREFHLEEYKQMKVEVATMMTRIETLMRLGLVAAAVVFSWLLTQGFAPAEGGGWCLKLPQEILSLGWYLPVWFALIAGLAAFTAYWRGQQMGTYIRTKLEKNLAVPGFGWETVLKPAAPMLLITGVLYWGALLGGTLYGAVKADSFTSEQAQAARACKKSDSEAKA